MGIVIPWEPLCACFRLRLYHEDGTYTEAFLDIAPFFRRQDASEWAQALTLPSEVRLERHRIYAMTWREIFDDDIIDPRTMFGRPHVVSRDMCELIKRRGKHIWCRPLLITHRPAS